MEDCDFVILDDDDDLDPHMDKWVKCSMENGFVDVDKALEVLGCT